MSESLPPLYAPQGDGCPLAGADLFAQVRVCLCRPQIDGNVGAIARSMLNFGPRDLYLANPKADPLSHEALRRARDAESILRGARVVDELSDALAGCSRVIGATARSRSTDRVPLRPRQAIESILEPLGRGESVALVFGHETAGMSNLELDQCHVVTTIPTCPDLPSLNVSMAASILLYELHQAVADRMGQGGWPPSQRQETTPDPPATVDQLEGMYGQMRDCLDVGRFLNPQNPDITMRYLRRFFSHSGISEFEVRLWRAIWRRLTNTIRTPRPRGVSQAEWERIQRAEELGEEWREE